MDAVRHRSPLSSIRRRTLPTFANNKNIALSQRCVLKPKNRRNGPRPTSSLASITAAFGKRFGLPLASRYLGLKRGWLPTDHPDPKPVRPKPDVLHVTDIASNTTSALKQIGTPLLWGSPPLVVL